MFFYPNPLPIIDVPADEAHKGHNRVSYEFIILHDTEGTDSRQWLSTTSNPPVSTQRLIGRDGAIYKLMDDADVAYGAGYGYLGGIGYYRTLNERSLQIELENLGTIAAQEYTIIQLHSAAQQVVEWYARFGVVPILYHRVVDSRKRDPYNFPRVLFDTMVFAELGKYL